MPANPAEAGGGAFAHGCCMAPDVPLDPPPIDLAMLDVIRSLGDPAEPDLATEVSRTFLSSVPLQLTALRGAIARRDAPTIAMVAHRLKGGALQVGALRMAPILAAIEEDAMAGSLARMEDDAAALDREYGTVREVLEREIAAHEPAAGEGPVDAQRAGRLSAWPAGGMASSST